MSTEDILDVYDLKPGDKVRTIDGSIAEIVNETQDGKWIKVRYVEGTEDAALIGTEDLCTEDELTEVVVPSRG
jgi:preprotein translocase subunit YajC